MNKRIKGEIFLPGDKSISHRAALFAAFRNGTSVFTNFNFNQDCTATLKCLQAMGVEHRSERDSLHITGKDLPDWKKPEEGLYAANSGTTARLLSGLLTNLPFAVTLSGDASLSKRPMQRIISPLQKMGAKIESRDGLLPLHFLPVKELRGITYPLPVASAQVKSAVLLAGLFAAGLTEVIENAPSRDHTERLLNLPLRKNRDGSRSIFSSAGLSVPDISMKIPGDFSSAAFFIAATLMLPGSELTIRNVSLNPTRTGLLDVLQKMGAKIEIQRTQEKPEPAGDLYVVHSQLKNIAVKEDIVPNIIDEIPILAILAARADGRFTLRGAEELRHKESDRLKSVAENLSRTGVDAQELADGLVIEGGQSFGGGEVQTYGDHRIAMSFAVANLISSGEIILDDPQCVGVSFPSFWEILQSITE